MAQHELLMMLAPPRILLGNPVPVLLWGLGGRSRLQAGSLLARHAVIRRARDIVGWMPVAWSLYVFNLWAWHHPALYQAALRDEWIHDLEHILFFLTALFWWPVVRPISRPAPIRDGVRIFYLFLAATQDALLSGVIALSTKTLYPHYETALRLWNLSPREDQIGGGIVMFAVGSVTYLAAILFLVNALLGEGRRKKSAERTSGDGAEEVTSPFPGLPRPAPSAKNVLRLSTQRSKLICVIWRDSYRWKYLAIRRKRFLPGLPASSASI